MKILITGALGQLGSELKDILEKQAAFEGIYVDREELPLDDISNIQKRLSDYAPDFIVHRAAYTAVDRAEAEPVLADMVNHLASAEIAAYCQQTNIPLIAISTDYVFDGESAIALKEDAPTGPISVYGKTKLAGELAVLRACPEAIIIRTAWVYSTYGANFVKTMLRLMAEREEIQVIDDQIGSPTYARDLAAAIVKIIQSPAWEAGIYHFSNAGQTSWYDFAVAIRDKSRLTCRVLPIPTSAYPTAAKRPRYSLLDKTKICNTFAVDVPHWETSLQDMLSQLSSKTL